MNKVKASGGISKKVPQRRTLDYNHQKTTL
nr:MAG TPA: hypothetical protein [Caudoviricetes sp.]